MNEADELRAELSEALTAQVKFNASMQQQGSVLSSEVLDLRADCLLLRTVVAALWGQASPAFRYQIELVLKDPAKAIFSTPLSDDQDLHLKGRGKAFQDHFDQVVIQ
jgi:hypothetical protein